MGISIQSPISMTWRQPGHVLALHNHCWMHGLHAMTALQQEVTMDWVVSDIILLQITHRNISAIGRKCSCSFPSIRSDVVWTVCNSSWIWCCKDLVEVSSVWAAVSLWDKLEFLLTLSVGKDSKSSLESSEGIITGRVFAVSGLVSSDVRNQMLKLL